MGFRGATIHFDGTSFNYKTASELTFTKEMAISHSVSILEAIGYFEEMIIVVEDVDLCPEKALEIVAKEGFDKNKGVVGYIKSGGGGGGTPKEKPEILTFMSSLGEVA